MTNPYRAMCAELVDALAAWQLGGGPPEDTADADLIDRARTLLAEPEAEGPSELELETIERKLWDKYRRTNARGGNGLMYDVDFSYALEEYRLAAAPVAIPGEKYHEDMGPVTWWRLPVDEPPWVGTPNDSDWPGYHTHFTPAPTNPLNAHALPLPAPEAAND